MKKTKLLCVLLTLVLAFVLLFALAACNPQEEHQHTYSENWTTSDTHHWHAATCGHDSFKSDYATHAYANWTDNGDGTCTATCVCGKTDTHNHVKPDDYAPTAEGHGFVCTDCGGVVQGTHDTNAYHFTAEGHTTMCSVCGWYDESATLDQHNIGEWADEDGDGVYEKGCECGYGHETHGENDHVYTKEIKQRYLTTYAEGTGAETGREITAQMSKDNPLKHVQICYVCGYVNGEAHDHTYAYADNYGYAHVKYCADCEFYDNNDGNYEDDGKGDGYAHENSEEVTCVSEASAMGTYGYHYVVCKYCHAETATIHSFDSNLVRIPNNNGTHTNKCNGCDYAVDENCTKAADGYETWLHDANEHWTKCVWCQGKLPATASAHTGANWVENDGIYTGTCSVCGESVTHTTHEWSDGWACGETDTTKHYHYCSVCHIVNEDGDGANHSYTNGQCVCGAYDPDMVVQTTGNTNATDITSRVTNNTAHFIATSSDYTGYYKYVAAQDGWVTVAATELTTDIAGFGSIYYNVVPDTTNATGNYIYNAGRSKVPAGLYSCTYTVNAKKDTLLSEFKLYVKQGEYIVFTVAGYKTGATMGTQGALTDVVLTVDTTTAAPAPVYGVTWDLQGYGTAIPMSATENGKVTAPTAPTAQGVAFGGWYTDAECTNAFDFNTTLTANTTLYAKWTINYDGTSAVSPLLFDLDESHTTAAISTAKGNYSTFCYAKITITGSGELAFAFDGTTGIEDTFGFAKNGNGFADIAVTEYLTGNMPEAIAVANGDIIYVKCQAINYAYTLNVTFTPIVGNLYVVTVKNESEEPLRNITVNFGATADATTYLHTATTDDNGQVKWSSELETVYVIIAVETGKEVVGTTALTADTPTTILTYQNTNPSGYVDLDMTKCSDKQANATDSSLVAGTNYIGKTLDKYTYLKYTATVDAYYTFTVSAISADNVGIDCFYINGTDSNHRPLNGGTHTDRTGNVGYNYDFAGTNSFTYPTNKTAYYQIKVRLRANDYIILCVDNFDSSNALSTTTDKTFGLVMTISYPELDMTKGSTSKSVTTALPIDVNRTYTGTNLGKYTYFKIEANATGYYTFRVSAATAEDVGIDCIFLNGTSNNSNRIMIGGECTDQTSGLGFDYEIALGTETVTFKSSSSTTKTQTAYYEVTLKLRAGVDDGAGGTKNDYIILCIDNFDADYILSADTDTTYNLIVEYSATKPTVEE